MPGGDALIAVLDVGGTTLTSAVVADDELVGAPARDSSRADASGDEILGGFAAAIAAVSAGRAVELAVVAIPAPFDYERGVSHMTHKFAALNGVDVGSALRSAIGMPVEFVNDARAAALGGWIELGRPASPVAMVTLGTGVGSGLVVDGRSCGHGELWCARYGDGIVEDHVSGGALRRLFEQRTGRRATAADIASLATGGDLAAIDDFATYGTHLGASLAGYFGDVDLESIMVSGGLTGAWHLIEPAATAAYRAAGGRARLRRSGLGFPALLGGAEFGRRALDLSR